MQGCKLFIVEKYMRKIALVLMAALMLCLTSCNKVKQISVTSVEVENVSLAGLSGVYVHLAVGVDNPAFEIGLSEIEGALKRSGKVLGNVAVDPFVLQARSAEIYHLKAKVTIASGVGLSELMALLDEKVLGECMIDVSARVTLKKGVSKVIRLNDIPVKKLLENTEK